MFYNHFIAILCHFWDYPIDPVPSASCCFLLVFYIAGNQYQTESKRRETPWRFFMGQKTPDGPKKHLGGAPRVARPTRARQPPWRAQVGCAHLGGLPHRLFAL